MSNHGQQPAPTQPSPDTNPAARADRVDEIVGVEIYTYEAGKLVSCLSPACETKVYVYDADAQRLPIALGDAT